MANPFDFRSSPLLVTILFSSLSPTAALAATVVPGFNTDSLDRCDDCSSGEVSVGFSLNFFGTVYDSLYVSNNGYVTFEEGQSNYTPEGLGGGYLGLPIIAAFYADVDTRNEASAVVSWGQGTYAGRKAFGVTWGRVPDPGQGESELTHPSTGVGYFDSEADKLNIFQLILTDRSDVGAGYFDIYFNYSQVAWETGDNNGGQGGLGGTSAAVGYNAGQQNAPGTFFELEGSRTAGSFVDGGKKALTNAHDGQLALAIREAVAPVPLPAAVWLLMSAVGAIGFIRRNR